MAEIIFFCSMPWTRSWRILCGTEYRCGAFGAEAEGEEPEKRSRGRPDQDDLAPEKGKFASESCAIDAMGADFVRDIRPGEIVIINGDGVLSFEFGEKTSKRSCIFEYICLRFLRISILLKIFSISSTCSTVSMIRRSVLSPAIDPTT